MDFGTGGDKEFRIWKDIWGSGQGIGAVKGTVPAGELVERLVREFEAAKARIE